MAGGMTEFRPHPYQARAIEWIVDHPACGLLLDMGLGKTVVTLTALQRLQDWCEIGRALVVAPKTVAESTWGAEAAKWRHLAGMRVSVVAGDAGKRLRALERDADVYVVGVDNFVWLAELYRARMPFDCLVLDELTRFKNHRSLRWKAVKRTRRCYRRVIGLTGTPAPNGLFDLWAQVYCLDGGERLGTSVTRWRDAYFDYYEHNHMILNLRPKAGAREAIEHKIGDICLSMQARDYLELPPLIVHDVRVELPPGAMEGYRRFERDMVLAFFAREGKEADGSVAASSAGAILVRERRVQGGWITLKRDGKEILTAPMTGELTAFKEAVEQENAGAVLTWEETVGFSDGSSMILEKETICLSDKNRERILKSRKRVPVGTRYAFCGHGHTVLETWKTEGGGLTHEIVNEENSHGEPLLAKGEAYTLEEIVVFSDGTEFLSGRVSVSIGENGKMILADLKNKETDVRIRKTDLITGEEISGAVLSIKSLDGKLVKEWISGEEIQITGILKPGETYLLAEVLPASGYAWAEEIPFAVGGGGGIHRVRMEDRPTQAEIRKTDMVTGEELPGAVLVLKDKNGHVVDRWTSGNTPHRIMGRLNAGEAYTLSEVTAPSGYQIAEEVTFTVSKDGTIDRVVMEDKRKEPEKPEKPGKPEKPERPVPDDDRETEPETPDETETPETEPMEEPRKKGIITAQYEIELDGRGELRISHPSRIRTKIPRAGDQQRPWVYGALAVLGILGGSICLILWRRDTFEK